jgi:hypothetical protein
MESRISNLPDDSRRYEPDDGPQLIGEILVKLLARYEVRVPEAGIAVVEMSVAVA